MAAGRRDGDSQRRCFPSFPRPTGRAPVRAASGSRRERASRTRIRRWRRSSSASASRSMRRTGIWCAPARATRKLAGGCAVDPRRARARRRAGRAAGGGRRLAGGRRRVRRAPRLVDRQRERDRRARRRAGGRGARPDDADAAAGHRHAGTTTARSCCPRRASSTRRGSPGAAWRSISGAGSSPSSEVKRVIDLIALYKLNVLQLHVTDDHTNAELRELIAYARRALRDAGVRDIAGAGAGVAGERSAGRGVAGRPRLLRRPRRGGVERSARRQLERTPRPAGRAPPPVGAGRADVFHLVGASWRGARAPPTHHQQRWKAGSATMTSEGVATGADELKQKLAQQIDAARNRLEALKRDVVSLHEDDMEMLRKKRDEIARAHRPPEGSAAAGARRHRALEGGEDRAHPRRDHVLAAAARAGEARAPRRARRGLRAADGEPGGDGLRGGGAGDPRRHGGALRRANGFFGRRLRDASCRRASGFMIRPQWLRLGSFGPRTSDLGPRTSDHGPPDEAKGLEALNVTISLSPKPEAAGPRPVKPVLVSPA